MLINRILAATHLPLVDTLPLNRLQIKLPVSRPALFLFEIINLSVNSEFQSGNIILGNIYLDLVEPIISNRYANYETISIIFSWSTTR